MHPRWYFEVPHNRNMNRLYSFKIYDFVRRSGRVYPLKIKGLDQGIFLI
jgi:hypothetical protein